jgi:hypothetical protein
MSHQRPKVASNISGLAAIIRIRGRTACSSISAESIHDPLRSNVQSNKLLYYKLTCSIMLLEVTGKSSCRQQFNLQARAIPGSSIHDAFPPEVTQGHDIGHVVESRALLYG